MNSGSPAAAGRVTAVMSRVVDVRCEGSAPPLQQMITAVDAPQVRLQVVEQRDEHTVRCLAFTSTSGLARGDQATASGSELLIPVGPELRGRVFDIFGETIDGLGEITTSKSMPLLRPPVPLEAQSVQSEVLTTGIKAIDLLAPIKRGGKAGLFGGAGVGKTVLITELISNMATRHHAGRAVGS